MEAQKRFNNLVVFAEDYVRENAQLLIEEIRGKHYKDVSSMINEKYHPICVDINDITFKIILKRFCIQLQNYQAMPRAINYISYSPKKENSYTLDGLSDNNEIYQTVINYLKNKFEDIPNSRVNDIFQELLNKDSNFKEVIDEDKQYLNNAWKKYSKGIMDVLRQIKDKNNQFNKEVQNSYVEKINNYCKYFDDIEIDSLLEDIKKITRLNRNNIANKYIDFKYKIKDFYNNIHGIKDALTLDFFKELHCTKLIKNDVHIKECYKWLNFSTDCKENSSNGIKEDYKVLQFIKHCIDYQKENGEEYTPYYIDKLLWLCCTGNFYEDGITIQNMNRKIFFEYLDKKFQ